MLNIAAVHLHMHLCAQESRYVCAKIRMPHSCMRSYMAGAFVLKALLPLSVPRSKKGERKIIFSQLFSL